MSVEAKVDFSVLRYANCWEDAAILLQCLNLPAGKKILCVASAGDNALALLTTAPSSVCAIDISKTQLYLVELKRSCFMHLEYEETLQFLGVKPCEYRQKLYQHLQQGLSSGAIHFWNEHVRWIEEGVIHQGKFEKYFKTFRKYLLPLVHSKKRVKQMFAINDLIEQKQFYDKQWNTWRWKLLMNLFFSERVMGKYGRDPEFFKYVDMPVSQYIRSRAEQHLSSTLPKENPFLQMIFTSSFNGTLPLYLQQDHYETIRKNIDNLELSNIAAETAIMQQYYDGYALSNIFEYISRQEFDVFCDRMAEFIPSKSRIAFWNLMAPRSFAESNPRMFRCDEELSSYLSGIDKGFFYSRFLVEEKI